MSRSARIGVSADGGFKLTLAAVYALFIEPLSASLQAPSWLTAVTAVAIAASGVAEVASSRTSTRHHVLLLAAYDAAWLLASLASFLIALAGLAAGGPIWMAVQATASAIIAVLFLFGPRQRARSRTSRIGE